MNAVNLNSIQVPINVFLHSEEKMPPFFKFQIVFLTFKTKPNEEKRTSSSCGCSAFN